MTDTFQLRRWALFALFVPLGLIIGICLANPQDLTNVGFIVAVFAIGLLPILMKWHHPLLIVAWNAPINFYFLPGQPELWFVMAGISLFFSVWQKTLRPQTKFPNIPFLYWPLFVFMLVVVGTAIARRTTTVAGSQNEIRRFAFLIVAILGFFALSFQKIPKGQAFRYATLFFASGILAVVSDLVYLAGPKFYSLYYLFPAGLAQLQATADLAIGSDAVFRLEGLAWFSVALCCVILIRYGVKGILDFRYPWRFLFFLLAVSAGLFGGFRSRLFMIGAFFIVQFCLEGLWRTRWLPILLGLGILVATVTLPFSENLPKPVQRAVSFLPVQIDPTVKKDAEDTLIWRTEMWRVLWPEVPYYFWLGKGYTYSATDYYLTQLAETRGLAKSYDSFILSGEYHNGPLSIILPLGIWGLLAFVWVIIAGWVMLYRNYKYGDVVLRKVNTFFLTYYTVRVFFFFTIYGAIHAELILFTGVLGLSVAINHGVKRKPDRSGNQLAECGDAAVTYSA